MLSVVMQNVVMLQVIMLSVNMLTTANVANIVLTLAPWALLNNYLWLRRIERQGKQNIDGIITDKNALIHAGSLANFS